ncbi:MAG: hypothetical protein VYE68_05720 [Acidobacteriota bacterium]|nr:hypothetical protein [Acidobacteriota bacterium]
MSHIVMSCGRVMLVGVTVAIALANPTAQAQDVQATVQIASAGQPALSIGFLATDDGVRVNLTQPQAVSIIRKTVPEPTMLMIQGGQCIQMGEQAFQMMQQMQGQSGGDTTPLNVADLQFQPTGQQQTFGAWTADGILVTGMNDGQEATMWISSDLEVGLLELLARIGSAFESMPIGGNVSQMAQFREIQDAAGLPDGGVVQLSTTGSSGNVDLTLQDIAQGSFSLDEPSSCQQMPSGLGLPE